MRIVSFGIVAALLITACQGAALSPTPEPPSGEEVEDNPPRTLTYCTAIDPETLYLYGEPQGADQGIVLAAIYDGPIDTRGFAFQPVILEQIPSLANGGIQISPVTVVTGDQVTDFNGDPAELVPGLRVLPSGCRTQDCAIEFNGQSTLQMDQMRILFQLLPDLRWSDGVPLTAADSVYSYQVATHPDTPTRKFIGNRTASYTALDEYRVQWVGLPGFLDAHYTFMFWHPLPRHQYRDFSPAELLTAEVSTRQPLGWGPYEVEDYQPNHQITLRRNEFYYRAAEGLPRFDRLVIRFVGEDASANIVRLLSGECDLLDSGALSVNLQQGQIENLQALDAQGSLNLISTTTSAIEFLLFGISPLSYDDGWQPGDRPDFFGDVRTRQALIYCLDRESLASSAGFRMNRPAVGNVHPQNPLFNPNIRQYPHDPEAGSALLESVGWQIGSDGVRVFTGQHPRIPAGTRLSVTLEALSRLDQEAAEVIINAWAECGIELNIRYWAPSELLGLLGPDGGILWGRKFDLAQAAEETDGVPACGSFLSENIPGSDPAKFKHGWFGDNASGFSHTEYDRVCLEALRLLPGEPGHAENLLRTQEIFAEQLPAIPLFIHIKLAATRPDFCGLILDPTDSNDASMIEVFDYGPDC